MICPLLMMTSELAYPCELYRCAWYDTETKCCSVLVIAKELKNFNNSIDEQLEVVENDKFVL